VARDDDDPTALNLVEEFRQFRFGLVSADSSRGFCIGHEIRKDWSNDWSVLPVCQPGWPRLRAARAFGGCRQRVTGGGLLVVGAQVGDSAVRSTDNAGKGFEIERPPTIFASIGESSRITP
jgi:hypothetical protein